MGNGGYGSYCASLSGWAVWLLRDTLKETKRAVKEATEATKAAVRSAETAERANVAQHRPWLKLEPVEVGPLRLVGEHLSTHLVIKATNISKYPAIDVAFDCEPYCAFDLFASRTEIDALINSPVGIATRNSGYGFVLLPEDEQPYSFSNDRAKPIVRLGVGVGTNPKLVVSFAIMVSYRSTVSQEWFHTAHIAFVWHVSGGTSLNLKDGEVPTASLALRVMPGSGFIK